jgi:hypothetical protein
VLHQQKIRRFAFEINHLNHQAGRGHFDDLIHLHCAVGHLLAVALFEFQNPRNDHIDATKSSAYYLMDPLDHFLGHLRAEGVTLKSSLRSSCSSTRVFDFELIVRQRAFNDEFAAPLHKTHSDTQTIVFHCASYGDD